MKKSATIAAAFALSGCALTPRSLTDRDPLAVLTSTRPAHGVAACLVDAWEETASIGRAPSVETKQVPGGLRVTLRLGSAPHYIALIESRGDSSSTTIWSAVLISLGGDPAGLKAARNCQ